MALPKSYRNRRKAVRKKIDAGQGFNVDDSSHIAFVEYDSAKRVMYVGFHTNGSVYEYRNVTPKAFKDFERASKSKGKHFHSKIRGKFEHKKTGKRI